MNFPFCFNNIYSLFFYWLFFILIIDVIRFVWRKCIKKQTLHTLNQEIKELKNQIKIKDKEIEKLKNDSTYIKVQNLRKNIKKIQDSRDKWIEHSKKIEKSRDECVAINELLIERMHKKDEQFKKLQQAFINAENAKHNLIDNAEQARDEYREKYIDAQTELEKK